MSVGDSIRIAKSFWRRLKEHQDERKLIEAYKLVEKEYQNRVETDEWAINEAAEVGLVDDTAIELKEYNTNILKTLQADRKVVAEVRHRCQVNATAKVYSKGNERLEKIIIKIAM